MCHDIIHHVTDVIGGLGPVAVRMSILYWGVVKSIATRFARESVDYVALLFGHTRVQSRFRLLSGSISSVRVGPQMSTVGKQWFSKIRLPLTVTRSQARNCMRSTIPRKHDYYEYRCRKESDERLVIVALHW